MTCTTNHFGRCVGLLCTLALAVAACGDDDADSSSTGSAVPAASTADSTSPDAPAETSAAPAADATTTDVCGPYISVSLAFNGEPDPATLSADLDAIDAAAPDDVGDELRTMTAAAREVLDSGGEDFSAFDTEEFTNAMGTVDPWMYEHCEFDQKFEVTALEYEFSGFDETVPAGQTAVLFTNGGNEAHEMAIMRKADGTSQSWEEILALDQAEAEALVEEVGGAFGLRKGDSSLAILDLIPGDYVAVCFVPTGTAFSDGEIVEGTGDPHFTHGMTAEFTVT